MHPERKNRIMKGKRAKYYITGRTRPSLFALPKDPPKNSAFMHDFGGFIRFSLSSEEYERLSDIEEDYRLLLLAQNRIAEGGLEYTVPLHDVMADLGISDKEMEEAEDLDIE